MNTANWYYELFSVRFNKLCPNFANLATNIDERVYFIILASIMSHVVNLWTCPAHVAWCRVKYRVRRISCYNNDDENTDDMLMTILPTLVMWLRSVVISNIRNEWRLWDNTKIVNSWVFGYRSGTAAPLILLSFFRTSFSWDLLTWKSEFSA